MVTALKIATNYNKRATTALKIATIVLILASCSTTIVQNDLPCPPRPVLTALSEDLQLQMPEGAIFIIAENQLRLKRHIKDLEVLAACE